MKIKDMMGKVLEGEFVGTIIIAVGSAYDFLSGWDYLEQEFLAFKLDSGPLVAVEYHIDDLRKLNPTPVRSLKREMWYFNEGYYPYGFPEEWMGEKPVRFTETTGDNSDDELPF